MPRIIEPDNVVPVNGAGGIAGRGVGSGVKVAAARSRGLVNEVLPGVLYQRGQILTWQREKKYTMLRDLGISTVVNFWPKMDADMAESRVANYLQFWSPRSEQMLEPRIEQAALFVAKLAVMSPVLVLCEAGVTRSVYFCVLLVSVLEGCAPVEAVDVVAASGLSVRGLKGFMRDRLAAIGGVGEAAGEIKNPR